MTTETRVIEVLLDAIFAEPDVSVSLVKDETVLIKDTVLKEEVLSFLLRGEGRMLWLHKGAQIAGWINLNPTEIGRSVIGEYSGHKLAMEAVGKALAPDLPPASAPERHTYVYEVKMVATVTVEAEDAGKAEARVDIATSALQAVADHINGHGLLSVSLSSDDEGGPFLVSRDGEDA